eukprot:2088867-Prorocentrum_lima.AAC.1
MANKSRIPSAPGLFLRMATKFLIGFLSYHPLVWLYKLLKQTFGKTPIMAIPMWLCCHHEDSH